MVNSEKEKKILVVVEKEGRGIAYITFELLRAGRELANKTGGILCAAVLGHNVAEISHEIAHFSDKVYCLNHILLRAFQVDFYVIALEKLCRDLNPDIVLMGHTLDSADLAPRLAYKMRTDLITDCIALDIEPEKDGLVCAKPVYGDNVVATFIIEKKPRMATLRAKVTGTMHRSPTQCKVIDFEVAVVESLAVTELVETVPSESVNLDKADVIVAGGRGVKSVEGLKRLEELTKVLKRYFAKVELGASRPLVDAGWLPRSRQLGLTGEKANPELYMAIGISGASQHLSGIVGSKCIVAINRDDQASIFKSADYGVVSEYEGVVPAFIEKLKELS